MFGTLVITFDFYLDGPFPLYLSFLVSVDRPLVQNYSHWYREPVSVSGEDILCSSGSILNLYHSSLPHMSLILLFLAYASSIVKDVLVAFRSHLMSLLPLLNPPLQPPCTSPESFQSLQLRDEEL